MVSEGGTDNLLDVCYYSKDITYLPALQICGQTHENFCVSSDIRAEHLRVTCCIAQTFLIAACRAMLR